GLYPSRTDYALNCGWNRGFSQTAHPTIAGVWDCVRDHSQEIDRQRLPCRLKDITDGLEKTYFVGERLIIRDQYETGLFFGDTRSMYECNWGGDSGHPCAGYADDTPMHDPPTDPRELQLIQENNGFGGVGIYNEGLFGSAHSSTWTAVFCD